MIVNGNRSIRLVYRAGAGHHGGVTTGVLRPLLFRRARRRLLRQWLNPLLRPLRCRSRSTRSGSGL